MSRGGYPSNGASSPRQRSVCSPRAGALPSATGSPSHADASASVATGPAITSSLSKRSSHSESGRDRNTVASSPASALLVLLVVTLDEVGAVDQLAEALPELQLDRGHREEAAVGRLVDAIAGEAAGQRALRLSAQPVRREPVGVVRHRDDEVLATPRLLTLEQRGENLDDGEERAAGEIGDLHGRQCRCGVREQPGPAGVVEIVPGANVVRRRSP